MLKLNPVGFLLFFIFITSLSYAQPTGNAAQKYFTDTELTDQYGETHQFYTDLLQDKVVAIIAFCSSQGADPVLIGNLKILADQFPGEMNNKIHLLAFSSDPKYYNRNELEKIANQYKAPGGMYFFSGDADNVKTVMTKLGIYTEDTERHSTLIIMGNVKTGLWKKVNGLAAKEEIVRIFESVLYDKGK